MLGAPDMTVCPPNLSTALEKLKIPHPSCRTSNAIAFDSENIEGSYVG